jgi:hypothetical protein
MRREKCERERGYEVWGRPLKRALGYEQMQWESYLQKIQLWIPSLTVENDVRGAVIPALCRDRLLCHPGGRATTDRVHALQDFTGSFGFASG